MTERDTFGDVSDNSFAEFDYAEYVELYEASVQKLNRIPSSDPAEIQPIGEIRHIKTEQSSKIDQVDLSRPLFIALADDFEAGSCGLHDINLPPVTSHSHIEGMQTPHCCASHKIFFNQSSRNVSPLVKPSSVQAPRKPRKRRILQYDQSFKVEPVGEFTPDGLLKGETVHTNNSSSTMYKRTKKGFNGQVKTSRRQIMYQQSDGMYLAVALDIPTAECNREHMESRKPGIKQKLRTGMVSFSVLEEFDIHTRAEAYIRGINPDRDFCVAQGATAVDNFEDCSIVQILSEVSCVQYGKSETNDSAIPMSQTGGERKRRRHSCGDVDCYVVQPTAAQMNQAKADHSFLLPEGLCLLRPPNKLVELVAQAINNSPDGMLQVQQVYIALQNKYPYFQYMDKASTTSWRSSIRHALYQKWFRKIAFCSEAINSKGCYWAINRRYQPREWTLPPTNEPLYQQDVPARENDPIERGLLRSVTDHHPLSSYPFLIYNPQTHEEVSGGMVDGHHMVIEPSPEDDEPCDMHRLPTLIPRPRDPDPMLSPTEDFSTINSQEIEISSHSSDGSLPQSVQSGESRSPTAGCDQTQDEGTDYPPVIVFEAPSSLSSEDPDYLGSLEWISSLDTCLSPPSLDQAAGEGVVGEYHAPLLAPYSVSYSSVPPIELADMDMDEADVPIYIQSQKPHDEHW